MRVLVIASDGFGGHGGIALYVRNLLRALCTHRSLPEVLALPRVTRFEVAEDLPPNLDWDTSGVGGKRPYATAVLRSAVTRGPFDLVLCAHFNLLPLAYPVAQLHRAPLALFLYGIEAKRPERRSVMPWLLPRIDALVSIRRHTTKVLHSWAAMDRVPHYLLENAIDLSSYGLAPKAAHLVDRFGLAGKRVVLTLSRLGEQYVGIDETLGALSRVAQAVPNVVYVVAGDGPDLPRLRAKARDLGVSDRVVFAGFVSDAEKADYYRLADAYAMPGSGPDFDRYPLRFGFLEAMACGIPVVGSLCEDEDERIADGGLLAAQVDPQDPDAIARAIVAALGKPKAVPAELDRFAYPSFERRWHEMMDAILANRVGEKANGKQRGPHAGVRV